MAHVDISHLDYVHAIELLKRSAPDFLDINIIIDFGTDFSQSKIIRDFVGSIFQFHHVQNPWEGRFVLITDELVNNAIEHGSEAGDTDTCIIHAKRDEEGFFHITLEVHDTGNGKDAKKASEMEAVKNDHTKDGEGVYMEKRGRGLFHITEKLVDRLEFSESPKGGLAVKIEKAIPMMEKI